MRLKKNLILNKKIRFLPFKEISSKILTLRKKNKTIGFTMDVLIFYIPGMLPI